MLPRAESLWYMIQDSAIPFSSKGETEASFRLEFGI